MAITSKKNVLNGSTTVRSLKTYEMHSGGQSHTIDFIAIQLAQNIACVQNYQSTHDDMRQLQC